METFDKVLERRLTKIKETLSRKGEEYAKDFNRLHNFDTAARVAGITPEKALEGMWLKHLVSVFDMIDEPENVNDPLLIDEKIGDTINYLVLLEFMLLRRISMSE